VSPGDQNKSGRGERTMKAGLDVRFSLAIFALVTPIYWLLGDRQAQLRLS